MPELVSGLAALRSASSCCTTSTDERREVVGGLARADARRAGYRGRLRNHRRPRRALEGADFVLIQIRVGGQAARLHDETRRCACGCIGQETTGAGGLAKGDAHGAGGARDRRAGCARRAAPGAWIVDFTNPVGIVTRALLDAGHRAVGLCNVAIRFQRHAAGLLGVAPERGRGRPGRAQPPDVGARACGSTATTCCGALLAEHGDALAEEPGCRGGCSRSSAWCPPTTCATSTRTTACWPSSATACRARPTVAEIERELLEMYRDPALNEKPALLEQRGGAFYSEAATGIVASLGGRRRRRARGRHAQRRHARRAGRRRRRRGAGARRAGRAGRRSRRRRSRPSCSGSSSTSRPTSGSRAGGADGRAARRRARRCSRTR